VRASAIVSLLQSDSLVLNLNLNNNKIKNLKFTAKRRHVGSSLLLLSTSLPGEGRKQEDRRREGGRKGGGEGKYLRY